MTKVAQVNLALFTGEGDQSQIRLRDGAGSMVGDEVAKVVRSALVAAHFDHGVQAAGPEVRELLQGLQNERQVPVYNV